ncbi:MAG TPA: prepilin-type N-terminal cleavage/methylation domain-containing protein, partial [Patescibacteria group bacterium]|nr:prepilin-type N-terminal cleavage/methylation domain-containing protein [Patescibacteria group bacterium]
MSGFTLIEVLIAAVIILVFSGISLAGYWQFNESKKLDEETKKFVETLMIAKQKAISGEARTCGDNGS